VTVEQEQRNTIRVDRAAEKPRGPAGRTARSTWQVGWSSASLAVATVLLAVLDDGSAEFLHL